METILTKHLTDLVKKHDYKLVGNFSDMEEPPEPEDLEDALRQAKTPFKPEDGMTGTVTVDYEDYKISFRYEG